MNPNDEMIEECPPGKIMIDIGAHHGAYTEKMAKKSSKVYAFEPEPKNIAHLFEAMKDYPHVVVVPIALSNFTGITNLMLHPGNPGGHSIHVPLDGGNWNHKLGDSIEVPVMKLDDWCEKNKVKGIAGIKIDVEAHELEVLEGAEKLLMHDHPFISLDTHQVADMVAVRKVFLRCGYDVPELKADHTYFFK